MRRPQAPQERKKTSTFTCAPRVCAPIGAVLLVYLLSVCTACVVLASLPGSTLDLAQDQFFILQADLNFGFATNNF